MIILPYFNKFFTTTCNKYSLPIDAINQASKLVDELKTGEAQEMFADIPNEHLMSYAISLEMLRVYHAFVSTELASPDLKEL